MINGYLGTADGLLRALGRQRCGRVSRLEATVVGNARLVSPESLRTRCAFT
ncbi:hypothetical protein [Mastigocladopsis repens]|uniref:hypothetical protein n=1 Tax=Mastigocladopsis repens TaxID=221287 RepID=UPI001E5BB6AC|nr:hypothetical protein [Mastigocladopsis repens]